VSDTQAKEMFNKLPVLEIRGADAIVRLKDERTAHEVARQIEGWFEKLPGLRQAIVRAETPDRSAKK
jgi:hypothetical protein